MWSTSSALKNLISLNPNSHFERAITSNSSWLCTVDDVTYERERYETNEPERESERMREKERGARPTNDIERERRTIERGRQEREEWEQERGNLRKRGE